MKVRIRPSANLMRWFTPGLHVKRWLLLLFVAVVMISLAAGYLLRDLYSASIEFPPWVQDATLQFLPRLIRALFFALVGVGLIVLSLLQARASRSSGHSFQGAAARIAALPSSCTSSARLPRVPGWSRSVAAPGSPRCSEA